MGFACTFRLEGEIRNAEVILVTFKTEEKKDKVVYGDVLLGLEVDGTGTDHVRWQTFLLFIEGPRSRRTTALKAYCETL
jgi:hypothetical protein